MTEMFGEAWSPMSVPDLAPDDDDDDYFSGCLQNKVVLASSGVPACKDGPALERSNNGVTAHLDRPHK